jgi:O-antigen/teichoic acid export membrane protein
MTSRLATPLSRRALAKNTLINLVGYALPLLVGLVAIPITVRSLGVERFGVLTLAWAFIGYFSLFDLGIGRAITQAVAERLTVAPVEEVARLAWTGLVMMLGFALFGALLVVFLSPWLVTSVLKIPPALNDETRAAFMLLAASIPVVVLSSGLAGLLTALQRFDLINALRIPMGIMTFLTPLTVLPFSTNMVYVCAALLIMRLLFLVLHWTLCLGAFPALRSHRGILRAEMPRLLNFGGWMTLTNVIGPLMVYLDRFIIGAVLSVAAVAYYVTPYEMVTRLWIVPAAIVAVLFPAFATAQGSAHAAHLYSIGARSVLGLLAPVLLVLIAFAQEILHLWLGANFAQDSAAVLQWLALGVYINSYAQVAFAFIQGMGRADLTAKFHLIELPLYIALMLWLLKTQGIVGAAVAWFCRILLDTVLLAAATHWLDKNLFAASKKILPLLLLPCLLFACSMQLTAFNTKLLFTALTLPALIIAGYHYAITPEEKVALRQLRQR